MKDTPNRGGWKAREEEAPSVQPTYENTPPRQINKTGKRDGVLYVAGEGLPDARVLYVATALLQEESTTLAMTTTGSKVEQKPRYMKGASGIVLRDTCTWAGLDFDENCRYTAVCKWLLPRENRTKPTKHQIQWGLPALRDEIESVKPDIIVCLGKIPFVV